MIVEFGAFSNGVWARAVCYWVESGSLREVEKSVETETRMNQLRVLGIRVVPDDAWFERRDGGWVAKAFNKATWAGCLELTAENIMDKDRRVLVWCEPRGGCCVVG